MDGRLVQYHFRAVLISRSNNSRGKSLLTSGLRWQRDGVVRPWQAGPPETSLTSTDAMVCAGYEAGEIDACQVGC